MLRLLFSIVLIPWLLYDFLICPIIHFKPIGLPTFAIYSLVSIILYSILKWNTIKEKMNKKRNISSKSNV